ncbi:MAG: efflux RND transporter periplasmic adaptor subunit [Gammaproteobacteria bacterium]
MLRSWLVVIVACLALAGALGYYKYSQIQAAIAFAAAFPEPVVAVEAVLAAEETWQPVTSVTAEVVATRSVALSSELAGTIVAVGFESGDVVEAGQVLVRLDTSEERAQLAAARADAEIARLELARNQKLIASGAAAEEARDRAKASYDAAVAAVNRLLAVIEKKTLRAPFNAITGLHLLEVGQYLDRGATIVRLIGVDDAVWIDFTLPQQQATVRPGETVAVSTPGHTDPMVAEVIARDAFVNERSRNVSMRALATDPAHRLLPGSLVTVEVPMGDARAATLVPVTAVRRSSFGASVYVLQPAEEGARGRYRAERRAVTVGPQRGDEIIIATGLAPGERVATDGAFKLRDGALANTVDKQSYSSAREVGIGGR